MTTWHTFSLDAPLDARMLCLEASAGTGKTYTIEGLITRLIVEEGIEINELLVVTFTRAATAELRARIRKVLETTRQALANRASSQEHTEMHEVVRILLQKIPAEQYERAVRRIHRAIEGFDEAQISTLHGFCQRALQEQAFESGVAFEVELVHSTDALLQEIAQDWWSHSRHDGNLRLMAYLKGISLSTLNHYGKVVSSNLDAPWCPEKPDLSRVLVDIQHWTDALTSYETIWAKDSVKILPALMDGIEKKYLVQTSFKVIQVGNKVKAMSDWLRNPTLSAKTKAAKKQRDLIQYFTAEYLESKVSKNGRKSGYMPEHPLTRASEELLSAYDRLISSGAMEAYELHHMHEYCAYVIRELDRRKKQERVLSFDDLLRILHEKVVGTDKNPALIQALRNRYKVALIDEFQDTDPIQWGIFEAIFAHPDHRMVVVGDPKQAIYSFRGADIATYIEARGHPEMVVQTLATNHRSDDSVVRAVEHLFTHDATRSPFRNEDIGFPSVSARHKEARFWSHEARPPGVVFSYQRREAVGVAQEAVLDAWNFPNLPQTLAAQIVSFLNDSRNEVLDGDTNVRRSVRPSDVAVLVRGNRQAIELQQAFRHAGLPSTVRSETSVFQSSEAEELEQVLLAVLDPSRSGAVRVALMTSILGQDITTLAKLETDGFAWNQWVEILREWRQRWYEKGFATLARSMNTKPLPVASGTRRTVPERLLSWRDGERRVTNLFHLLEVIQEAVIVDRLTPKAVVYWLRRQRAMAEDAGEEHRQLRLESDQDAVTITTIHKSKGLQYGFVWCPDLWINPKVSSKNQFPLRFRNAEDGDRWWLDLGLNPESEQKMLHCTMATQTNREESLRLLYVAMTRARHQVHVLLGAVKELQHSPLGYLLFPRSEDLDSVPVEQTSDSTYLGLLRRVVNTSAGTMALVDLNERLRPETYSRQQKEQALTVRAYTRGGLEQDWRRTSFSGLTRGDKADKSPIKDHDALTADTPLISHEHQVAATQGVLLADFPRGARTGNCLHKIYEDHDFLQPMLLAGLVKTQLEAFGFDAETWTNPLVTAIQDQLNTSLCVEPEFCLAALPKSRRFDEMDFTFALPTSGSVGVNDIAALMDAHPGKGMPKGYTRHLRRLNFKPLQGYMNGSIDLVFEHDGRWFVVDYKSNHLGATVGEYGAVHMAAVMSHSHYVLQYHIYAVALHRYLQWRLGDAYDYPSHFGGVRYLFLRGMSSTYPEGTGVFIDRPPEPLIDGLSRLLREGRNE